MEIVDKIIDGTRTLTKGIICKGCSKSVHIQSENDNQEIYYCTEIGEKLNFPPVKCNSYYPSNLPSIHDLYQTAWILETSKNSRTIGFTPYSEWKEKNPKKRTGFDDF